MTIQVLPTATSDDGLMISFVGGTLGVSYRGVALELGQKWKVFYALLTLAQGGYISTEQIYDYYPWTKVQAASVGRMIWRFTHRQEEPLFGERISLSPPRQSTMLFALTPHAVQQARFVPSQEVVANGLQNLRSLRDSQATQLSEMTLLLQSGYVQKALEGLLQLRGQALSLNDLAHTEVLLTMALDRQQGTYGSAQQVTILLDLLGRNGLSHLNRVRLLTRLARHFTLSAQYPDAATYFEQLKRLAKPDDGVEFCQYQINYALYLRRTGELDAAIAHTLMAHDQAHSAQWWYGVQATQSNLALMYLHAGRQGHTPAERLNLHKAKKWALKGMETIAMTLQGADEADMPLLLGCICRNLNELDEAREWFAKAIACAAAIPSYQDWWSAYEELALLEKKLGNTQAMQEAQAEAAKIRILQQKRVNE